MPRKILFAFVSVVLLAACNKNAPAPKSASPTLLISAKDVVTLALDDVAAGPVITGTVQPERRADLRAEVSAVVLQVLRDNGEVVKQGETLVRLDPTAIRDTLTAADASARSAAQAQEQAARQLDRLKTLRQSGMASTQALEDAEIRRNNLQSDGVAARARAVQARQQMQRTEVRAPFDGVVSERKVSVGDTVQIGKELIKVIDPTSMRFEGLVSADHISGVQLGQAVRFRVNGYDQQNFNGSVKRIAPAADPTTRQVEVLVAFADGKRPAVSGLYAEGQIAASTSKQLMLPEAALVRNGDQTFVWRVQGKVLKKVAVTVAPRDPRRGDYPVTMGLAAGDRVVRDPLVTLKDGQSIELAAAPPLPAISGGK